MISINPVPTDRIINYAVAYVRSVLVGYSLQYKWSMEFSCLRRRCALVDSNIFCLR
jgi:hypothetical protein